MTVSLLETLKSSPYTELGAKAITGAGFMVGACLVGDWVGARIFRYTGLSLMNITPRWLSRGIYHFFGNFLGPINLYFERRNSLLGRVVIAPLVEEWAFRSTQVFLLSHLLNLPSRVALSSFAFTYAHGEAQPGKSLALLFIGSVLSLLAEWNQSGIRGVLTAILAHSIYNLIIDHFYVQILRIEIK